MPHLSESWYIIPLKFFTWNILWSNRAHESTNFQIFECFNESSPNLSCKVYPRFASLFSVMKDNSSYLKPLYFGQNDPIKLKFSDFWMVGWKFTKFLMSCLKQQVSFLQTLHHSSVSWEIWLSCTFLAETVIFKLSANFQTLDCSCKISTNLYFDRFLL